MRKKQMKTLLLETIRFENGKFFNLERHTTRMNRSRKMLFGITDEIDPNKISSQLRVSSPEDRSISEKSHYKCRVIYAEDIETIEFVPYQLPLVRSLKIITDNTLDYSFKYLERNRLEQLYKQKDTCDDILIVKNGLITDTYFANILFYNGTKWITPAHPLLKGTQRQYLLETDQIVMADIRPEDLKHFQKARLINAMIGFEDRVEVDIRNVRK